MARYEFSGVVRMAEGAATPAWPLPEVKPRFATWSLGGGRPSGCARGACERWHCGIDLIGAREGSLIVATEDCTIIALDRGWSKGSRAVFVRTDTGLFLVYGGTLYGSGNEWSRKPGDRVPQGEPLGRVKGSYGMLHFETYVDDGRLTNSRWYVGDDPPDGLLNPLNYIQRSVGRAVTRDSWAQRQQALVDLGYLPDPVGSEWGDASREALRQAQRDLAIEADGLWGEETERAIAEALDGLYDAAAGDCDGGPCTPKQPPPVPDRPRTHDGGIDSRLIVGAGGLLVGLGALALYRRTRRNHRE